MPPKAPRKAAPKSAAKPRANQQRRARSTQSPRNGLSTDSLPQSRVVAQEDKRIIDELKRIEKRIDRLSVNTSKNNAEISNSVWNGNPNPNSAHAGYASALNQLRKYPIPECMKGYLHALCWPTKINPFKDVCNIGGEETLAMYFPNIGRGSVIVGPTGEFCVALNPFGLANDVPYVVASDPAWSSGGVIDVNVFSGTHYPVQLPFSKADLQTSGPYQQVTQGRTIAAGLCLSTTANITDTQGNIYIYYAAGNSLTQKIPTQEITANPTAPVSQLTKGECYNVTYDPATNAQNNFLNSDPTLPLIHPFDDANKGCAIFVYGEGLKAGTTVFFEHGIHAEYNSPNKLTSLQRQTKSFPQAAQQITRAINEAKVSHPASKPHEGFFDKVLHVVKEIAAPIGSFVGSGLKALFA